MPNDHIAVIGCGPKALALACKNVVLKKLGLNVPRISIFEKNAVAAHWNGKFGFTHGRLPLGTSPEKDLGFPYSSTLWGDQYNEAINHEMLKFSWKAYLIHLNEYSQWIDRGRPTPKHREWANYLQWVKKKVQNDVTIINAEVFDLSIRDHHWKVRYQGPAGEKNKLEVGGVVITGPGVLNSHQNIPKDDRIFDFISFWKRGHIIKEKVAPKVAVIGAGENAASVAVALAKLDLDIQIEIISPLAMSYSRGESFMENHMYTDPFKGNWYDLTYEDKINFINRTDRGVFSMDSKRILDEFYNIEIIPGWFRFVRLDSHNQLTLHLEYNKIREIRVYDYIVVATGFDHIKFIKKLIKAPERTKILTMSQAKNFSQKDLSLLINENLAIDNCTPNLHLPMIAGVAQGPGFPNLSCLGLLSDRILSNYVYLH